MGGPSVHGDRIGWGLFIQRDQWIGDPLCGTKCPGNICVWTKCVTVFISTRKNINFNLDLIELIDFYFRLHFVFILISIHILQYKECGQSWKLILRKLHFLIFILVVMGHHDFKIWTSNWVKFSSNLYYWKTECNFFLIQTVRTRRHTNKLETTSLFSLDTTPFTNRNDRYEVKCGRCPE